MKKLTAVFLVILLTFGGCSLRNTKPAEDMPADTPWNRNIMETDNGYYYGYPFSSMRLKYVEKSNGTDIFLCAKPECPHEGDESCTATYKHLMVSNYILYEGKIYFVANTSDEETQGVSLYKASLDGTALDKVCDIRRVKYKIEKEDENGVQNVFSGETKGFIIHKGYAYVSYCLGDEHNDVDFIETGFARVDIQTGDTEIIESNNTFETRTRYDVISGIDDYIYYTVYSSNWGKSGFKRYNIKNKKYEKIEGELGKLMNDRSGHYALDGIMGNTAYINHYDRGIQEIIGYDIDTAEQNGVNIQFEFLPNQWWSSCYYDGKIFTLSNETGEINVYSGEGELIGGGKWFNVPENKDEIAANGAPLYYYDLNNTSINNGKLYVELFSNTLLKGMDFDESTRIEDGYNTVYCCPIDDVIAGKINFTKAYERRYMSFQYRTEGIGYK